MQLRQPRITDNIYKMFLKHHEKIQKLKKTGDLNCIYENKLDKVCFSYNTAYADSKNLTKRASSGKILKARAYEVTLNPKYDRYQKGLENLVHRFLIRKQDEEQT